MVFGTSQQTDTERLRMYLLKEWLAQSKVAPHFDCPTVYMRQKIPACFPRICQSLHSRHKTTELTVKNIKARFQLPELTARVDGWPLLFPLPVNTGPVDGRAFPLAELTGNVDGPSTRLVETSTRQHGPCWQVMESGHRSTRLVETSTRQHGPCWQVMENGHRSTRVVETGLNSPPFMKHWDKKVSCEVLRTTAVLLELLCIRDG